MNEHPNAERIRELLAAFERADVAAIEAVIPDDAVWHFPGRSGKLAGSHRGRDGILEFLGDVMALTEGTFSLELVDVLATDDNAVVLFRGSGRRGGKTLDNPTCLRIRIEDGRIVEVFEFVWDLYHVDDFWS